MKISRLITWITFLAIFAMASRVAIDTDTWWHMRAGQWMVENRAIMRVDSFSYTHAGTPWTYPGLWVQVLMFLLFDWFGPGGLNLWTAVMVTASFWFVWKAMPGNVLLKAFVVVLAAAASGIYWAARPYLLTFLLAAVFFYLLERYRKGEIKTLWLLPFLMLLWVNSHGGFLVGFLLVVPYGVELVVEWLRRKRNAEDAGKVTQNLKHLLLVTLLLGLVLFVNPQGAELLSLPFTTISRGAEQNFIAEWQSPNFHDISQQPFAWLLLLTLAVLGASRQRVSGSEILLILGFGFLGLMAIRNIYLFVIVAPAVITRHAGDVLARWRDTFKLSWNLDFSTPPTRFQGRLNCVLVVILACVAFFQAASVFPLQPNWEVFEKTLPVDAVEFIKSEKPEGRMFNAYNYGGYLIWALPEYPVFIDGRADLHGDEIINQWLHGTYAADDWQEIFDRWDVGFVLVEPGMPILDHLQWAGWELIYEDDLAVVYKRAAHE